MLYLRYLRPTIFTAPKNSVDISRSGGPDPSKNSYYSSPSGSSADYGAAGLIALQSAQVLDIIGVAIDRLASGKRRESTAAAPRNHPDNSFCDDNSHCGPCGFFFALPCHALKSAWRRLSTCGERGKP
jgi:hypothetical protein